MTDSDQVSLAPNYETYVGDGKSSHEESHLDHAGESSRWAQMTMYFAGRSEAPRSVSNFYWTSSHGGGVSHHHGKAHALVPLVEYKSAGTVVFIMARCNRRFLWKPDMAPSSFAAQRRVRTNWKTHTIWRLGISPSYA